MYPFNIVSSLDWTLEIDWCQQKSATLYFAVVWFLKKDLVSVKLLLILTIWGVLKSLCSVTALDLTFKQGCV